MLADSFGRTLDYLRVSVTDRCNLRCVYCMPPDGVEWKPHSSMLSFEELLRVCRVMAELGVHKIKVTGGEPLVRRGAALFIKNLKELPGIEKVTLTTNGLLLGSYLDEAESLGALPDSINISLDALDQERYKKITGNNDAMPNAALKTLDRLLGKNINVKINCVPVKNINEEEILPMAALAKNKNIAVRFIELMPLGSAANLKPVPGSEIIKLLEKTFGTLTPYSGIMGNGPAVYYKPAGFTGAIGFINAISSGFCETCNRLRLTSDGFLKLCLSDELGLDIRELLRSGADDKELSRAITEIAAKKPRFHSLSGVYNAPPVEHRGGMSGIGG